jgi:hypothetical protein
MVEAQPGGLAHRSRELIGDREFTRTVVCDSEHAETPRT